MKLSNPSFLSAMAGITDGKFALRALNAGAGGAVIGSYNIDKYVLEAAIISQKRGRTEFCIPITELSTKILQEIQKIAFTHTKKQIFLSIRFSDYIRIKDFLIQLLDRNLPKITFEINAHCQQEEIMAIGGGQALLKRLSEIQNALKLFQKMDFTTSVKVRSSQVDCFEFAKLLGKWGVEFLHLDAYIPGKSGTDFQSIQQAARVDNIAIIGNNSVIDVKIANQVLSQGAVGFSLARAALHNPQIFSGFSNKMKD